MRDRSGEKEEKRKAKRKDGMRKYVINGVNNSLYTYGRRDCGKYMNKIASC